MAHHGAVGTRSASRRPLDILKRITILRDTTNVAFEEEPAAAAAAVLTMVVQV